MIPTNKKIAILHPHILEIGGAVKMMIFLANFLCQKGNYVCFFTTSYDKHKLFDEKISFDIKIMSKFKISYEIKDFDYIIVGNSPMQFVGGLSKILFRSKAKIIWWHHHYPWYYSEDKGFKNLLKKYLEKVFLKSIDLLVGNSLYIKESLLDIYKIKNVEILNPVLDKHFFQYKNKKYIGKTKKIISYGRWVKGKNLEQIFETYEYISKFINVELLIGGVGEELNKYKNKYKGNTNINFLGFLDKKSIISNLEKSNIFLFPSEIDSFGISALEAIFIGVPVIAFDNRGIKEIVTNGKNGYLVSNSYEFNKKALELLIDTDKNIEFSSFCYETKEKFTYQRFEKQLENIFKRLLE